ncbi:hypothetical protein ABZV93_03455 [Actinopolymorpha sp. NPDC004070]|uniref:hypothetical protein n=1 Tax=Actinopolymorpha sp. NPDC004070 TaxID=3154548 RepID=UPI0033A12E55
MTVSARNEARTHVEEVANQLAAVVHQLARRLGVRPRADHASGSERSDPNLPQSKTA